ncbi:BON domain-containing protein [Paraburkholderia sp. WSM4175]|uniref:BON domain-containing protein n=1 Tax=Paraburkholderia sp. WSM4175 TaxID=2991072 RepID=UPI003D226470
MYPISRRVEKRHGVAYLWGIIESEEEKRAIRVDAENVPGVKRVESYLESPRVIPTM